jgi:hypothetical protein
MTSLKVLGLSSGDPKFRVYLLFSLKLMRDVKSIFSEVHFLEDIAKAKNLSGYDVVITDSLSGSNLDLSKLKSNVIVACLKSNFYQNERNK